MTSAFISNLQGYLDAYNRTAASAALSLLRLQVGMTKPHPQPEPWFERYGKLSSDDAADLEVGFYGLKKA